MSKAKKELKQICKNIENKKVRKKMRRAMRRSRLRFLKNLLIWFMGFTASIAITIGAVVVGFAVIPVGSYFGNNSDDYVSGEVSTKTLYEIFSSLDNYDFSDFPVVETYLKQLMDTEIASEGGESIKLGDVIAVDYTKLNNIKVTGDVAGQIPECLTFDKQGVQSLLGDQGQFEMLTNYTQVAKPQLEGGNRVYANPELYYYADTSSGGNPFSAGPVSQTVTYRRAFDDNGMLVSGLADRYYDEDFKLYFAPLLDFSLDKVMDYAEKYIGLIPFADVFGLLQIDAGKVVEEALGNLRIGDLMSGEGGFTPDAILSNLTLSTILSEFAPDVLQTLSQFDFFGSYAPVLDNKPVLDSNNTIESKDAIVIPQQYYVYVGSDVYERAFDDNGVLRTQIYNEDGQLIYTINDYASEPLYYADLLEVSVTDALVLVGDSIMREKLTKILQVFEIDTVPQAFVKLFEDKTLGEISAMQDMSDLLSGLSLNDLELNGMLGALSNLGCFNQWKEVTDKPQMEGGIIAGDVNHKLFYYVKDASASGGLDRYAPAFDENGAFVDGVYASTTLYYANLSEIGLTEMGELLGDCLKMEKASTLLGAFGLDCSTGLMAEIVGDKTIGELANLSLDTINLTTVLPFEQSYETYKIIISALGITWTEGATELETKENIKAIAQTLTVASLKEIDPDNISVNVFIKLDDKTAELICSGINGNRAAKALSDPTYVKPADVTKETLKITDFSDFDPNYILLCAAMPEISPSSTLYKILDQAFSSIGGFNSITIMQLKDMNINSVKLGAVMPELKAGDMLYDVLDQAFKANGGFESVTIAKLAQIDLSNVYISTVMPSLTESDMLYKVLDQAFKSIGGFSKVTIAHLKTVDLSGVLVSTAMPTLEQGDLLYDILDQAFGTIGGFSKVTIAHLSEINVNDIKLGTVMTSLTPDSVLYKVLTQVFGDFNQVKIGQLSSLSFDNVKLETVLPRYNSLGNPINTTLYSILDLAINDADNDGIEIGELGSLDTSKIKLDTVLPYSSTNSMLYKVMLESAGIEWTEGTLETLAKTLTVGNIKVDMMKVKLKTVLGNSSSNAILDTLIKNDVCVGEIGTAIDGLSLYEIYGEECFTQNPEEAVDANIKFKLTIEMGKHVYTHDDVNGNYYLHKDDGIWLLLCFEGEEFGDDGRPERYVETGFSFGDLSKGDSISSCVMNATLRQLIDAGMISDTAPELYNYTLATTIEKLSTIAKLYPHLFR